MWVVRDREEETPEPRAADLAPATAPTAPSAPSAPSEEENDEDDARELRMERVAVLFGEITAATRAFLAAVAECDRHGDWRHAGFGSCAEWLAWRIGVTRNTANEKVRVALALEELPLTSDAMARGELSFSKVRALTRQATPGNEAELLELARAGSAAHLERVLRGWTKLDGIDGIDGADEARRERALHKSRRFSVFPDPESQGGMYVVKGRLTPEVAAVLMRTVEAASDALFRDRTSGKNGKGRKGWKGSNGARATGEEDDAPDPAQLRADAMGLVAERALAAGFQGPDAPISGSRAERYQVMLHVEERTLEQGGQGRAGRGGCTSNGCSGTAGSGLNGTEGSGVSTSTGRCGRTALQPPLSELKDGTRVTAETARRLSCDAARVVIRTKANGDGSTPASGSPAASSRSILASGAITGSRAITGAGHRTRTIPPATRRALEARDRGCRFPGCGLRFTDGHHIVHWADGGPTTLKNLVLLCPRHHRRVHEGQYQVCSGADGKIVFFTPAGRALYEAPPPPELPDDPVAELVRRNRDRGVVPDGWGAAPRWHRDVDIPWSVEAAAREALDPWDDEVDPHDKSEEGDERKDAADGESREDDAPVERGDGDPPVGRGDGDEDHVPVERSDGASDESDRQPAQLPR